MLYPPAQTFDEPSGALPPALLCTAMPIQLAGRQAGAAKRGVLAWNPLR